PILPEEDPAAYDALLARVLADVKPTGTIEEILVRDIVDLSWEILRWRKIRTGLIKQAIAAALKRMLARRRKRKPTMKPGTFVIFSNLAATPSASLRKLVHKWTEE